MNSYVRKSGESHGTTQALRGKEKVRGDTLPLGLQLLLSLGPRHCGWRGREHCLLMAHVRPVRQRETGPEPGRQVRVQGLAWDTPGRPQPVAGAPPRAPRLPPASSLLGRGHPPGKRVAALLPRGHGTMCSLLCSRGFWGSFSVLQVLPILKEKRVRF